MIGEVGYASPRSLGEGKKHKQKNISCRCCKQTLKNISFQKQLECATSLAPSVLTLTRSRFLSFVMFSHYLKIWWHFDIRHCIISLCCVFVGWINEWLLGRKGGMRQECVNYEWSFSRGLLRLSLEKHCLYACVPCVCLCVYRHACMFNSMCSEQPCRKSVSEHLTALAKWQ